MKNDRRSSRAGLMVQTSRMAATAALLIVSFVPGCKADTAFKCGNNDVKTSVEHDAGLLFGKLFAVYIQQITIDPNAVHFKLTDTYEVSSESDTKQCAGSLRELTAPGGTAVPVQYHVTHTDEGNILYGLDVAALAQTTKGLIIAVAAGQLRFDFMDNNSEGRGSPSTSSQNMENLSGIALKVAEQAKVINRFLPKDLDNTTTMTSIEASGTTLIYHYKLRVQLADKKTAVIKAKETMAKQSCGNPAVLKDFAAGITHEYKYSDSAQNDFADFSIGIEDCDAG